MYGIHQDKAMSDGGERIRPDSTRVNFTRFGPIRRCKLFRFSMLQVVAFSTVCEQSRKSSRIRAFSEK